jgi:L-malate glycosyltransferase
MHIMNKSKVIKVIILGNVKSPHIQNWSSVLGSETVDEVISLTKPTNQNINFFSRININIFYPKFANKILDIQKEGALSKSLILIHLISVLWRIYKSNSQIVHVHYASSYGLFAALLPRMRRKWILSVWGSDLYNFPKLSYLHKKIFAFTIGRYDKIQVTSHFMLPEMIKWTHRSKVDVIPFPIDINKFKMTEPYSGSVNSIIRIGTIKTLHPKYGIDILINVAEILKRRGLVFHVDIYGDGPQKDELLNIVNRLEIKKNISFHGFVEYQHIHQAFSNLDVYIALSREDSETFGVAVLEASSSQLPVVVSSCGGLPEVVVDGQTGFVVNHQCLNEIADKVELLINDAKLRREMGVAGRKRVEQYYSSDVCAKLQIAIYKRLHSFLSDN